MKLILGGYAQGKSEYVRDSFSDYELISYSDFDINKKYGKVALKSLHLLVRSWSLDNLTLDEMKNNIMKISSNCESIIFITDEVGSGIIPMEKADRIYRENTGRISAYIASQSDTVIRVICGNALILKG